MKKEEILARSRAEKKDEGTEYAMGKGRLYGIAAMTIIYLALLSFNWVYRQNSDTLFAMYWIYVGFELLGRYKVTKKPVLLFGAVMGILACAGFLTAYVIRIVR